ncbi:OmpA family protein [Roseivivax lentus]|uniref:OmpA family protein n=1 Tax=Roseivivax lentus TaxID=633194 RepID=A0A1N7Q7H6_9RHOB|nr:OmpA family protein [Roseivivax lentus]SIT18781.1 OmpA family protein [Roseivivax lentus]
MKTGILKTTTALALVASLTNPALSQTSLELGGMDPAAALELVLEERAAAEAAGNSERVEELDAMIEDLTAQVNLSSNSAAEEEVTPQAEAEAALEAEAEAEAEAEPEGEAEVEAEPEDAADSAVEASEPAESAAPAEESAPADPDAAAEEVTASEEQGSPSAEAEPATETDAEIEAAPEATAEETSNPAPVSEDDAMEDGEPVTESTTVAAREPEAETEAEVETATETEAETEAETDTEAEVESETKGESEVSAEPVSDVVESDPQAQADAIAEEDATASAAAADTADASGEGNEPEVVEETVTQETARSSSEEFETSIVEGDAAAQRQENEDEDDDNDRQDEVFRGAGAALLGLGVLAIGDILRPDESVVSNTGDRLVVERDGQLRVLRNDDALLRQPGSNLTTYRFDDGSTRTVVVREDGSEIETIRARDGRVLRRTRTLPSGESYVLFDDTQTSQSVTISELPEPSSRNVTNFHDTDEDALAAALSRLEGEPLGRTFSLNQVRNIDQVRKLMPEINVDTVNFESGSAVIRAEEAEELQALGRAIRQLIAENPSEVFLIEGHTDAVGRASYNLALSDRRAESVALALTEYFDVPPENMVIQGYGESDLLVRTQYDERANRRAAVRRITPLLQAAK